MRVFDCLLLEKQEDLDFLEARFRELEGADGLTHVIAEAETDHQGSPKPLHFQPDQVRYGRFWPWRGRWTYITVPGEELPPAPPKERKDALREFLAHGLSGDEDDIVLHGALTEFPRPEIIGYLARAGTQAPVTLQMRTCAYRPGLVHPEPWRGTAACRVRDLPGMSFLREQRGGFAQLTDAGTRLAHWGEPEPWQALYPDGRRLRESAVDATWPRFLREQA
jgi:hypothetical protein